MSSIIASSLPRDSSNDEIVDFFTFGEHPAKVEEITPLEGGHKTKTVRVSFDDSGSISNALLLNGTDFKGTTIRVAEEAGGIKSRVLGAAY